MTHLTDDTLITKALLQRFALEAEQDNGTTAYYALIRRSNGDLLTHHPFGMAAEIAQILWANDLLRLLNTELHHDGAWVICFTHPAQPSPKSTDKREEHRLTSLDYALRKHTEYQRYALIWIDEDGDPNFTVEWTALESTELFDFAEVVAAGIESTAQKAETAWQIWYENMKLVIEPREGQTFKRAKGQRAPSARV